jgi:hypothetical protein
MRKLLKIPNWKVAFLMGILSIIGALFLWCPDPPASSTDTGKFVYRADGDTKADAKIEHLSDHSVASLTRANRIRGCPSALTHVVGLTSGNTDIKPTILKAGFEMPTAVGVVLFVLLVWGVRQRELEPALITGQKMVGLEWKSSNGLPPFMMKCETARERHHEMRRLQRDENLYAMCAKVFRNEGDNEEGRQYLLGCLINRLPKKAELIRKAFEDTRMAA